MFQSEHLVEKWDLFLSMRDASQSKTTIVESVTAVLLENQEKFLKEQMLSLSQVHS